MMNELIAGFPAQMQVALELCKTITLTQTPQPIRSVLVCGLGGSGIAGDLAYDLIANSLLVPLMVSKGYSLPAFADASTLLIMCSYSGNTEETLSSLQHALDRGLRPVCVASGGKLKEIAIAKGLDFIQLPTGYPPRTTLGYGSAILLHILNVVGLTKLNAMEVLAKTATFLTANQESIKTEAQRLAKELKNKTIILYSEDSIKSAALRLKQQINENSKSNCWYSAIPELNHNELVGWKFHNDSIAVLNLRTDYENPRNVHRFSHIRPVVAQQVNRVSELHAQGSNFIEQYFYLIHTGDWLSYYLAVEHGVDPVEVKVIDSLKSYLSSIN